MLSHDFGNTLPDEGKTLLSRIFSASERMSTLIQDVLDFSRVDSANNTFVETSLDSILDRVLDDFTLLIAEKKAIIKREKLPVLDVAPLQINQLFNNLLSNSLKFTHDDKQPVITITSRMLAPTEAAKYPSLSPEHAYCEIRLEDNGIGFEEKYADKIFLIFQRLHSRQQYSGTGIGLALCKKIVINHHGEIFAESKDNANM